MAEDTLFVQSNRTDNRVALWETDPAHPNGEVYVAANIIDGVDRNPPVEVAKTAGVMSKLGPSGELKVVESAERAAELQREADEDREERAAEARAALADSADDQLKAQQAETERLAAENRSMADELAALRAENARRNTSSASAPVQASTQTPPAAASDDSDADKPADDSKPAPRQARAPAPRQQDPS